MSNLNFRSGNRRRWVFYFIISASMLVLVLRFFSLQVLDQEIYRLQSEANSVKKEVQLPIRGQIYDRNGALITDNRPAFSIYVIPAQIQKNQEALQLLAEILETDVQSIKKNFNRYRRFQPVKIARYVSLEKLAAVQANKLFLPGVEWRVEPKRNYLYNRSFAHLLGTLGEVTENDLEKYEEYELGDLIGKKGLEKSFDLELRGHKGYRFIQVDALGREVRELETSDSRPPYPGKDLYLTIDARLQLYADSLFGDHNGALVAVDTRNGEILTMVSKPDYDLNWFTEGVDPQIWRDLLQNPRKPLFDRVTQGTYPPGSTYKMVAAIAALNEGIVTPEWRVFCPGYLKIGRRIVRCWNAAGHGEVNMISAIRGSCNVYFYQLGMKIGIEQWTKYSKLFRFGEKTGIELRDEKSGLVPSRAYYERRYGKDGLTAGLMANIAIGQGELLTTPVQMAQFAMMLANSGTYYQPHLFKSLVDRVNNSITNPKIVPKKIPGIKPEIFAVVREGMRQVVAGGTGWRAGVWRITGAGKTGTAQNPHGDSHSWYIGFYPFEEPEIAIAVLVENGGSGGGAAASIAGQYLRRYFYFQGKFSYEEERAFLQKLWAEQQRKARLDSLKNAVIQELPVRPLGGDND